VRTVNPLPAFTNRPARVFLTPRGAIAYVNTNDQGTRVYVARADAVGHRIVARGARSRLPISSVRVRGNRLSWRIDGRTRSVAMR
jgi:hypothetical protein